MNEILDVYSAIRESINYIFQLDFTPIEATYIRSTLMNLLEKDVSEENHFSKPFIESEALCFWLREFYSVDIHHIFQHEERGPCLNDWKPIPNL